MKDKNSTFLIGGIPYYTFITTLQQFLNGFTSFFSKILEEYSPILQLWSISAHKCCSGRTTDFLAIFLTCPKCVLSGKGRVFWQAMPLLAH